LQPSIGRVSGPCHCGPRAACNPALRPGHSAQSRSSQRIASRNSAAAIR
jgi:hypothetical protein